MALHNFTELAIPQGIFKTGSLQLSTDDVVKIPAQYLDNLVTDDVVKVDDKVRDEAKMRLLLRSLARSESTIATRARLKSDMQNVEQTTIDEAAAKLLDINQKFERPATSFRAICGLTKAAYRRPNGVFVVPITALKP